MTTEEWREQCVKNTSWHFESSCRRTFAKGIGMPGMVGEMKSPFHIPYSRYRTFRKRLIVVQQQIIVCLGDKLEKMRPFRIRAGCINLVAEIEIIQTGNSLVQTILVHESGSYEASESRQSSYYASRWLRRNLRSCRKQIFFWREW
jgi:hypothetical protein